MKPFVALIFYVLILCLAIFAGSYLFQEQGYVLLGYGKYYLEATLMGLLLGLLVLWVLLKLLATVVKRLLRLSGATGAFFSARSSRKASLALQQGLNAFLLKDWSRAEKLLTVAGDQGELGRSKRLYAAVAADAMGDQDKVQTHLAALDSTDPDSADPDSALVQAQLLIKHQALAEAELMLKPLLPKMAKNDAVLSCHVKLLQAQQDWAALLHLLPQITKQGLFSDQQLTEFSLELVKNSLMASAAETAAAIEKSWKSLPGKMKKRTDLIAVYIAVLASHGDQAQAETLLLKQLKELKALKEFPLSEYLPLFRQPCFGHSVKLKAYVQSRLKTDENHSGWLCALGYLALAGEDYSLACKTLGKVAAAAPELLDLWLLADAYARLGEQANAIAVYQKLRLPSTVR